MGGDAGGVKKEGRRGAKDEEGKEGKDGKERERGERQGGRKAQLGHPDEGTKKK